VIYFKGHIGLGDIIATAAIINKLAMDAGEVIILPCYDHNEESVRSIFINVPNIELDIIHYKEGVWPEFLYDGKSFALGHYAPDKQRPDEDFVQWFYRQAGMTYEDRQKYCPIKEASKKVLQTTVSKFEYDFIHDTASNGEFKISYQTDRITFRPGKHGSILKYCEAIENAYQVHCIDSSFFHLTECLNPKGELFYHKTRPNSPNYNPIHLWK